MIEKLCSKKTETHETHLTYAKANVEQDSFDELGKCEEKAKE